MVLLVDKLKLRQLLKIPVRYKNPNHHWSVLKKRKTVMDKALQHFDEFYGNVYGKRWTDIRAALLKKNSKYMAVVNNFSDVERIQSELELLGAINLKTLYNVQKENMQLKSERQSQNLQLQDTSNSLDALVSKAHLSRLESIYPSDHPNLLEILKSEKEAPIVDDKKSLPIKLHSLEPELNEVQIDTSRIIDPNVNVSLLHEYVPATKIKGMDEWVLESDQYRLYAQAEDFKINVSKESVLSFPEHLHLYIFESGNSTRFPSPKLGSTGVLDYYLFDGGSVLPVLALDIQPHDVVLDMCAAPGGKSLTILQTLLPRVLVVNDIMESRVKRINNVIKQYIANIGEIQRMLFVTERDARLIDEKDVYNKILVDVPCTTDRHVLHSDENNIFKSSRIKERLKIPEVQSEILTNALKLVTVGGTVVYATCSLSPIQNDGVVQIALKRAWEETRTVMVVKEMSEALLPLKSVYSFSKLNLKYGHIVVPTVNNNWGPMYFCKMVKVK